MKHHTVLALEQSLKVGMMYLYGSFWDLTFPTRAMWLVTTSVGEPAPIIYPSIR